MSFGYRIKPGTKVSLGDLDTSSHGPFVDKNDPLVAAQLKEDIEKLADYQQRLFAEQRQSLLVVLQAMDTAGKDGVLRHVVGPLDSRGVHVWSFREPTYEDKAHDFLWRFQPKVPRKGDMAFFNRSYYEDVLVVRVMNLSPKEKWSRRFEYIRGFEALLTDSDTRVVKIFLHISKDEQKRRLQERIDNPDKHWKFDPRDLEARNHWDEYRTAYEEAMSKTSTDEAPWWIVPADRKWYRDLAVARILVDTLAEMKPCYPEVKLDLKGFKLD